MSLRPVGNANYQPGFLAHPTGITRDYSDTFFKKTPTNLPMQVWLALLNRVIVRLKNTKCFEPSLKFASITDILKKFNLFYLPDILNIIVRKNLNIRFFRQTILVSKATTVS